MCIRSGHNLGSAEHSILLADVEHLAAERSSRRNNTDTAITALLDGGLGY